MVKLDKNILFGTTIFVLASSLLIFQMDFWVYCSSFYLFNKTSAQIESVEKYAVYNQYNDKETICIRLAKINYSVNGKKYDCDNVIISYCEKEGDFINIAYRKGKPEIVRRCEFLPLSKGIRGINWVCSILLVYYLVLQKIVKKLLILKRNSK